MEANELMRNDWVCLENDNTPRQVDWIRSGEVGLFWNQVVTPPYLKPIPLTEEILEKNGFEELVSDGKGVAAMLGRKSEHTRVWMYCIPGTFDSVSYVPERKLLQLKIMEGGIAYLHNLQYVHELQHFLRLFGVEKEIIL